MFDALITFTESMPTWLQWLGVMLISAIPFVESYLGTFVGVLAGVPTLIALGAAVVGNVISMIAFVFAGDGARKKALALRAKRRAERRQTALVGADGAAIATDALGTDAAPENDADALEDELSPRQLRFKKMFDRFGVPGVSLLGQAVLPSQLSSGLMVSLGASRNTVIVWQIISIILWGVLFAVLANLGVAVLR